MSHGEFAARVELEHEAMAITIDQPGALAASGLADQVTAAAGDVKHRGMKLHELHVAQLGAGPIGDGCAIAGGYGRIGRFAVELPGPAGGHDGGLRPDHGLAMQTIPDDRPAADTLPGKQIDREGMLPNLNLWPLFHLGGDRADDLPAGGIAEGMGDAVAAVAAFASQGQMPVDPVKIRSIGDQLLDAARGLAHHALDHLAIAQRAAGFEGVGRMIFAAILRRQRRQCRPGHRSYWTPAADPL